MSRPFGFIVCFGINEHPALYRYIPLSACSMMWNDMPTSGYLCAMVPTWGTGVDHKRHLVFKDGVALLGGLTPRDAIETAIIESARCLAYWEALQMQPMGRASRELWNLMNRCVRMV